MEKHNTYLKMNNKLAFLKHDNIIQLWALKYFLQSCNRIGYRAYREQLAVDTWSF